MMVLLSHSRSCLPEGRRPQGPAVLDACTSSFAGVPRTPRALASWEHHYVALLLARIYPTRRGTSYRHSDTKCTGPRNKSPSLGSDV